MSTNEQSDALILRQAVKVEDLEDPIKPVQALLNRVNHEELIKLYQIESFNNKIE